MPRSDLRERFGWADDDVEWDEPVKLARMRVWVPPHPSVSKTGKHESVRGYWRKQKPGENLTGKITSGDGSAGTTKPKTGKPDKPLAAKAGVSVPPKMSLKENVKAATVNWKDPASVIAHMQGQHGWSDVHVTHTDFADMKAEHDAAHKAEGADAAHTHEVPKVELGADKDHPVVTGNVDKAARLLGEGKFVRLKHKRQVSTLLDELARLVEEAKKPGNEQKTYDLCKVSVKNTNLFCAESKGIQRVKMPQLAGKPESGSPADKLEKNKFGEVDLSEPFVKYLESKGIGVQDEKIDASFLKASQDELNGGKVAGIVNAINSSKMNARSSRGRIWTSNDDYIIDGHHRWAATVAVDLQKGKTIKMPIHRVNLDIITILDLANRWTKEMGIPQAGVAALSSPMEKLQRMLRRRSKVAGLARVYIKPYVKPDVVHGGVIHVKGYWQDRETGSILDRVVRGLPVQRESPQRADVYVENHLPGHNKFWKATVEGKVVHVAWGKVGSKGQSKDFPFSSAGEAQDYMEKKTSEKLDKGYEYPQASYDSGGMIDTGPTFDPVAAYGPESAAELNPTGPSLAEAVAAYESDIPKILQEPRPKPKPLTPEEDLKAHAAKQTSVPKPSKLAEPDLLPAQEAVKVAGPSVALVSHVGGSDKFWRAEVDGTTVHSHWGKNGTHGQSKDFEFDTASEAVAYFEKKRNEKLVKGYFSEEALAAQADVPPRLEPAKVQSIASIMKQNHIPKGEVFTGGKIAGWPSYHAGVKYVTEYEHPQPGRDYDPALTFPDDIMHKGLVGMKVYYTSGNRVTKRVTTKWNMGNTKMGYREVEVLGPPTGRVLISYQQAAAKATKAAELADDVKMEERLSTLRTALEEAGFQTIDAGGPEQATSEKANPGQTRFIVEGKRPKAAKKQVPAVQKAPPAAAEFLDAWNTHVAVPSKPPLAEIPPQIKSGAGRGPTGKLRNFHSMGVGKLGAVIEQLKSENDDPEALQAAQDALTAKTGKAPEVPVPSAAHVDTTVDVGIADHLDPTLQGGDPSKPAAQRTKADWAAVAAKHGVLVTPDMTKVDIMDALREALGTFDPTMEIDPAKAISLNDKIDWKNTGHEFDKIGDYLTDDWVLEPKYDGARFRMFLGVKSNSMNSGRRSTTTHKYTDRSENFPQFRDTVVPELAGTVLDGELLPPVNSIDLGGGDMTQGSLNTVMSMMNINPKDSIARQKKYGNVVYEVFDVTSVKGEDVTKLPFSERRKMLEQIMSVLTTRDPSFRLAPEFAATKENIYHQLDLKMEGVMLKKKTAVYQPGKRMTTWAKVKKFSTGDFYIIGSIPGKGSNSGKVGSLKVAYADPKGKEVTVLPDGTVLHGTYVADVAGFDEAMRAMVTDPETGDVKKEMLGKVIEVSAQARTKHNRLRHPNFERFRDDKSPDQTDEQQLMVNFNPS